MTGTTIAQYKILEKLGEGGMGVVCKAEDVKLKQTVALKFLPHHVSATEEERARFFYYVQRFYVISGMQRWLGTGSRTTVSSSHYD